MLLAIGRLTTEVARMDSLNTILQHTVNSVAQAFSNPDSVFVSIIYKGDSYTNGQSSAATGNLTVPINVNGAAAGSIALSFDADNQADSAAAERFATEIAEIIATQAIRLKYTELKWQNRERLKELDAINYTTQIIKHGLPIDETLQSICSMLPRV